MQRSRRSQILSTAAGVALLFVLVAYRSGAWVATLFVVSGLLGYFNTFAALPTFAAVISRHNVKTPTALLSLASITGSAILCYLGYWAPVVLCTGSFLVIWGVVSLFSGPSSGTTTGEP